jgi:uncharacterized metal-binding protein
MLVDEKILINISYRNITHYRKIGYYPILNEKLEIFTFELPSSSHEVVSVKCELCNIERELMYGMTNTDSFRKFNEWHEKRKEQKILNRDQRNLERSQGIERTKIVKPISTQEMKLYDEMAKIKVTKK